MLVVGGGPAGLAAAIACRQQQLQVCLAEWRWPPVDKACGEGLMPGGVAALRRLGVSVPAHEARPFRGIRLHDGGRTACGLFRGQPGLGLPRTTLHRALTRRAEEMGVGLLWGQRLRGLAEHGAVLDGGPVRARWIVGADGLTSGLRHRLGLDGRRRSHRIGFRRHYRRPPWSDLVEVHYGQGCDAYVTPLGSERIGVAVLSDTAGAGMDDLLGRFPSLARRLDGAAADGPALGAATLSARARRFRRGRVLLLGDAAVSVDAITGDGVSLALQQALALAPALAAGRPRRYEQACARLARPPLALAAAMLALHRRPRLRRAVLLGLSRLPLLLNRLLDIHALGSRTALWRAKASAAGGPPAA